MTWWQWCLGSLEFVTALLVTDWLVYPAKRKARVAKAAERRERLVRRRRAVYRGVPPGWGLEDHYRLRNKPLYRPYRKVRRASFTTMPPAR